MIRPPDIPSLQGSPINAPQASARAAAAPAAALGSLASAIAAVGKPFEEQAIRVQNVENQHALSATRNQLDELRSQHFIELEQITDPAERIKRTDDFLRQSRHVIDQPDFAPVVREKLITHFDAWATDTRTSVAERAASLANKRAIMASDNELTHRIERLDYDGANAILDEQLESGLRLPEEIDQMRSQLGRQMAFQFALQDIDADPLTYPTELDSPDYLDDHPDLTFEDLGKLRRHAAQSHNAARAEFFDEIRNSAMSGTVLSDDDLEQLAQRGLITAAQRAQYRRSYLSGEEITEADPGLYDSLHSAVQLYDPANDPTGIQLADLKTALATAPLPKQHRSELSGRLDKRTGSTSSGKHRLTRDFQQIIDERFDAGEFGTFDLDDDRTIDDVRDFEAAIQRKRQFLDAWQPFLETAPDDLDPGQARQAFDALFEATMTGSDDFTLLPDVSMAPGVDYGAEVAGMIDSIDIGPGVLPPKPAKTFGGIAIQPPGKYYTGAKVTVFGGTNDPLDSGRNMLGEKTGRGGVEGVAIPQAILEANFGDRLSGKNTDADKRWIRDNVRVVVKTPTGQTKVLPVVDYGTAEKVWKSSGRAALDFTPGALRAIGGHATKDASGKLTGVSGVDGIDFAITTTDAGMPLQGASWRDVWTRWFQTNRPKDPADAQVALQALLTAYYEANQ